jgi:hypothetical protein
LPTLIQNGKEKATVTRVRETYSLLSQAYKRAENEYGTPENWQTGTGGMYDAQSHIDMATPMKEFLKLTEDCVGQSSTYTKRHCTSKFYIDKQYASVVLANGVSVIFRTWSNACSYYGGSKGKTCGSIAVELEPNKTSKSGENTFEFYLTKNGIIPFGLKDDSLTFERACNKSIKAPYPGFSSSNMYACTGWVIVNQNMDYLHCDDLSWDGKKTCK